MSRMTLQACLAAVALGALVPGCTYVKMTAEGAAVEERTQNELWGCERVGTVNAQTRDKVVLNRGAAKVQEELLVLAHNEAAAIGANAISPEGPAANGQQRFAAWRCPPR